MKIILWIGILFSPSFLSAQEINAQSGPEEFNLQVDQANQSELLFLLNLIDNHFLKLTPDRKREILIQSMVNMRKDFETITNLNEDLNEGIFAFRGTDSFHAGIEKLLGNQDQRGRLQTAKEILAITHWSKIHSTIHNETELTSEFKASLRLLFVYVYLACKDADGLYVDEVREELSPQDNFKSFYAAPVPASVPLERLMSIHLFDLDENKQAILWIPEVELDAELR